VTYWNEYYNGNENRSMNSVPSSDAGQRGTGPGQFYMEKTFYDFRSCLNIIIGNSELMLNDVMVELPEEQRVVIRDILTTSRRSLDIVNDITRRRTSYRISAAKGAAL
jgi:hypothetical protein